MLQKNEADPKTSGDLAKARQTISDESASKKTISQPGESVKTSRKIDAKTLEQEINAAGLHLTSKDNNKNNLRILGTVPLSRFADRVSGDDIGSIPLIRSQNERQDGAKMPCPVFWWR